MHKQKQQNLLMRHVFYNWRQFSEKYAYSVFEAPEVSIVMRSPISFNVSEFVSIEVNEMDTFREKLDFSYDKAMISADEIGDEAGNLIDDFIFIPYLMPDRTKALNNIDMNVEIPKDETFYDVDFDLWEVMYYQTDRILPPLIDFTLDKQIPINEGLVNQVSRQRRSFRQQLSAIVPSFSLESLENLRRTPLEKDIRCRTFDERDAYDASFLDSAFEELVKEVPLRVEALNAARFVCIFEFNDRSYDSIDRSLENAVTSIVRRAFVFKFDVLQPDTSFLRNCQTIGLNRVEMSSSLDRAVQRVVGEAAVRSIAPFDAFASAGVEAAFAEPIKEPPHVMFKFSTDYV